LGYFTSLSSLRGDSCGVPNTWLSDPPMLLCGVQPPWGIKWPVGSTLNSPISRKTLHSKSQGPKSPSFVAILGHPTVAAGAWEGAPYGCRQRRVGAEGPPPLPNAYPPGRRSLPSPPPASPPSATCICRPAPHCFLPVGVRNVVMVPPRGVPTPKYMSTTCEPVSSWRPSHGPLASLPSFLLHLLRGWSAPSPPPQRCSRLGDKAMPPLPHTGRPALRRALRGRGAEGTAVGPGAALERRRHRGSTAGPRNGRERGGGLG